MGQTELALVEVREDGVAYEYAALVTSLCDEIRTLAQQYRDRADAENIYDELKNQWGWGGYTTQDMHQSAAVVARDRPPDPERGPDPAHVDQLRPQFLSERQNSDSDNR